MNGIVRLQELECINKKGRNNMKVKINDINKIKQVCKICNQFVDNVYAESGNYRVNAKSILGLLSLDLSQEIELVIDSYKDSTISNFVEKIRATLQD